MKKHEGMTRGFCWGSKAWYAETAGTKNEISIGMYDGTCGTSGEMRVAWKRLLKNAEMTPQVKVFDDGWSLFVEFADMFAELAGMDDKDVSEDEFIDMLIRLGFKDFTPYKREDSYPNEPNTAAQSER